MKRTRTDADPPSLGPQAEETRKRLEALGGLLDTSSIVLLLWRLEPPEWPLEVVSENVLDLTGYPAEDFTSGRVSWPGIVHPEDLPRLERELGEFLAAGRDAWSQQYRVIRKSGRVVWVEDRNRTLRDARGTVTHVQAFAQDITERKREEKDRQFQLDFQKAAAETSTALTLAVTEADFDRAVDRALERLGRLFALGRAYLFLFSENLERMTTTHEWCAKGVEPQMHSIRDVPVNALPWWKERILRCRPVHLPDVEQLPPEAEAERREFRRQDIRSLLCLPMRSPLGTLTGFLGFDAVHRRYRWPDHQVMMLQLVADSIGAAIARRRAEAALRESEALHRLLASNSVDMISRHAPDGTVRYVSPACEALSGYSQAELIGVPASFFVVPEDVEQAWAAVRDGQETGHHYRVEHRLRRKDGAVIWVETVGQCIRDAAGRVIEIQCNVRDITGRKEVEAALRESDERLRFLSDHLPGGLVYQIDSRVDGQDRRLTYVSAGVEQLHEISAAEAMEDAQRLYGQIWEEDRARVAELEAAAFETMSPFHAEVRVTLPSGRTGWRRFASAPRRLANNHVFWDGIEIDITQHKHEEESRQRMRSLEGLATVAGGIAHDFNNLLTGMFNSIELARLDVPPGHPALEPLQTALQALEYARQLTTRLLTFAKGGRPLLEGVDLRRCVGDTVRFHLAGSNVAARFDMAADLWPAKADRGQIAEVVSNLTVNAREAMPGGGTFHVEARNVPAGPESASDPPEDRVEMVFRDEGVGIPASIIERVFDPYYTTKQAGSGLGLAIVHGIVSRHEGHVGVESVPGCGTTFTVSLPADTAEGAQRASSPLLEPGALPGVSGHILLMDDEEMIRKTASQTLLRMGYSVETAIDGGEAIEKYAAAMKSGRPFDLAILDLTVPGGMGGKKAVRELLVLDPSARAVVSSGYCSDPVLADFAGHGFCGCLVKPFNLRELGETVSRALKKV